MANRKPTSTQTEYSKELRRIKQFIRRAEKRGYQFDKSVIPNRPTRITQSSVRKLQNIRPKELYAKATYTSGGKTIKGTERRTQERRISAQKGVETRRRRIEQAERQSADFESRRKQQDEYEKRRLEQEEHYRNIFNQGMIVYERLKGMIASVREDYVLSAQALETLLEKQIERYGETAVLYDIATYEEEVIEQADIALRYKPNQYPHQQAMKQLYIIINGALPTAQEARDFEDTMEQDMWLDVDEDFSLLD